MRTRDERIMVSTADRLHGLDDVPQLLTIDQPTQRLGITERHGRRLVAERHVPYLKVGKLVRLDPSEIAAWLDHQRRS